MTDHKDKSGPPGMLDLYSDIPNHLPEELFQTLIHTPDVRIERIISRGHQTPADEWYESEGK